MTIRIAGLVLLPVAAVAQATFVVDLTSGPGTNFTQIQAAVLAVPSGSVLQVRPGAYQAVDIDGKALRVMCAPGVTVNTPNVPFLRIANTSPTQVVVVSQLQSAGGTLGVNIQSAAGLVVLDGNGGTLQATGATGAAGPTVTVANSPQVAFRNWVILGGVLSGPSAVNGTTQLCCVVQSSMVAFESCDLRGQNANPVLGGVSPARTGLTATNSVILLSQTNVAGGNGFTSGPPSQTLGAPAIEATNCTLSVRGDSVAVVLRGGLAPGFPPLLPPVQANAVAGTGTLRIDPAVGVVGQFAAGVTSTIVAMPLLQSTNGILGGVATAHRYGLAGALAAIAVSLPGPSSALPPLPDPIWLDSSLFIAAFGIVPTTGLTASISIPAQPALEGFPLVWQAADFGPTGIADLSNPSPMILR
jgi:hypothetical protein